MKGRNAFLLAAAYGLSWVWAVHHPYRSFFFLLLVGFIASVMVVADGLVKALPYILLGIALSIITSLFPPLVILETFFLLYKAYKRRRFFLQHALLFLLGLITYSVIFFGPHLLAQGLLQTVKPPLSNMALFTFAVLLFTLFCFILRKVGYDEERTAMHALGFPGIIFLFWFSTRNFSGRVTRRG